MCSVCAAVGRMRKKSGRVTFKMEGGRKRRQWEAGGGIERAERRDLEKGA